MALIKEWLNKQWRGIFCVGLGDKIPNPEIRWSKITYNMDIITHVAKRQNIIQDGQIG